MALRNAFSTSLIGIVAFATASSALAYGGGGFSPAYIAPVVPAQQPATQGQVLGTTSFKFTKKMAWGSEGTDVTELQKFLTKKGFYNGPTNGNYGPLTTAAVKKLQKAYDLEQVGNVGPKTLVLLNMENSSSQTASAGASVQNDPEKQKQVGEIKAKLEEILNKIKALMALSAST